MSDHQNEQGEGRRALTDRDLQMIEFARLTWSSAGRRESAILDLFGITTVRYTQIMVWLLDHPEAEAYDPVTIRRLRRLQERRGRGVRSGRLGYADTGGA